MARKQKRGTQGTLPLKESTWGGKREGAGRKPKGPRPLGDRPAVPHLRRPEIQRRHPVHVTVRLMPDVWNLRSHRAFRVIARALRGATEAGLRLTHYSVQGNHLHLIGEAETRTALSRAMRSLNIRVAKGLNELMRRSSGRVIADRYHVAVLDKPQLVRNTIRYVLSNTRKHLVQAGRTVGRTTEDAYAAGPREHVPSVMRLVPHPHLDTPLVQEPASWLLRVGWRRTSGRAAIT